MTACTYIDPYGVPMPCGSQLVDPCSIDGVTTLYRGEACTAATPTWSAWCATYPHHTLCATAPPPPSAPPPLPATGGSGVILATAVVLVAIGAVMARIARTRHTTDELM